MKRAGQLFVAMTSIVVAISVSGFAQAETVRTKTGKEVRIRTSNACGESVAPSYRVAKSPDHGTLSFRTVTPRKKANCSSFGAPTAARAVFYKPNSGFRGTDNVTLEWQGSSGKPAKLIPIAVIVN